MLPLFADVAFDTDAAGTAETADGPQEKPALLGLAAEAAGVDAEAILGESDSLYGRRTGSSQSGGRFRRSHSQLR